MKRIIRVICICIFAGVCILTIKSHRCSSEPESSQSENGQLPQESEVQAGVEQTFVSGNELLEQKPMFCYTLGDVLQGHSYATKTSRLDQNELNFCETDGITYVVGQENALLDEQFQYVLGVILTDSTYHLQNGLQVGLDESEVKKICKFSDTETKSQVEESMAEEYPYLVQLSNQYDYDEAYWVKSNLSEAEWHMYDNGFYGKIGVIVFLKDHKVVMVSTDYSDNTFYATNHSFYQFSIHDLFLNNQPLLQERLWIWADWKQILTGSDQPYQESVSSGDHDLKFSYRKMQGITYVTPQYETGDAEENLCAILVTDEKYEFGCGLRVGMSEEKLNSLGMPLTKNEKGKFESLDLQLLSDLVDEDYDCLYTFDGGYMNPWETEDALAHLKGVKQDTSIHQLKVMLTVRNHKVQSILAYL